VLYQSINPHGGDIYGGEVLLDFSANTNPYGTPQGVLNAITAALPQMHRYPDPYCRKLIAAIASHEQIPADHLLCGNGAAELIYSYCEALKPNRALELAPTFAEYSLGLQKAGCEIFRHFLCQDNDFVPGNDLLESVNQIHPNVIFLCSPNNPTGKCVPAPLLKQILDYCRQNHSHLFLDECFLDLTDDIASQKEYLDAYPELFILKAFTKSYGMAGIRLGYGMTSDHLLLSKMSETVQPWNVSSLAQVAGIAALQENGFLEMTKKLIRTQRAWLKKELESLGFWVSDSQANYLLFKSDPFLKEALAKQKISIRSCDNYHGLSAGWYRIAVRLPEENQMLIIAIKEIFERN